MDNFTFYAPTYFVFGKEKEKGECQGRDKYDTNIPDTIQPVCS